MTAPQKYNPKLYSYQGSLVYPFWAMDAHFRWAERNRAKELEEIDARWTVASKEGNEDLQLFLGDQNQWLDEELPNLQWRAQFLLSYSQFEISLDSICTILHREYGYGPEKFKSKHKEKRGDRGIQLSDNWMIEIMGVTEPFEGRTWQLMQDYGVLRNTIAHQGGEVQLDEDFDKVAAINRIDRNMLQGIIEDDNFPLVKLSYDFVSGANHNMREFIHNVASQEFDPPA